APFVPGVPPRDNPNEGADYAAFLKLLRSKLDKGKTLSIAAPGSYWYLLQFPIQEISETVDYIVLMTNHLQKQWDSLQRFNDPSCPTNDCLRNPLDHTATWTALIVVMVPSYGQSFKLEDRGCPDPPCRLKGKIDEASKNTTRGLCTNISGIMSNAEIDALSTSSSSMSWYDKESQTQILLYDNDNWVSFLIPPDVDHRKRVAKNNNLGGVADFVDLDSFHDSEVSLETLRHNIKFGGKADSCDWELRTGTWINHTCAQDEVAAPFNYTNYQRWAALDADSAWNDAKARWLYCDKGKIQFTQSVTQFFHANENAKCNDLAQVDNCEPIATCSEHNVLKDAKKSWTGPAAYIVWNSLATVHAVLKNYQSIIRDAGAQVDRTKNEFLDTFAPEGEHADPTVVFGILLTLWNAPLQVMGSLFFKTFVNNLKYFKENPLQADVVKDISMQLVSASFAIGGRFIKPETYKEVSFSSIFDILIGRWQDQVDSTVVNLFSGSEETLARLDKIIEHGKMVPGAPQERRRDLSGDHTNTFIQQKVVERVFWSAAIPLVWRMRRPDPEYPVILDFGPYCNRDIGSGDDWFQDKVKFNDGYVCYEDHNYIVASVIDRNAMDLRCRRDIPELCANNWYKRMLLSPPGLKNIWNPDMKFGNVTIEDLVVG
ncbi:hypothetical protein E4U42_001573, partial [Claviceps africana]